MLQRWHVQPLQYGARNVAMIEVLRHTGVRAAELCGMRIDDVDWHRRDRKIRVRGEGRQGTLRPARGAPG